jgi:hypothetical protein
MQRDLSVDVGEVGQRLDGLVYINDGILVAYVLVSSSKLLTSRSNAKGMRAEHRRSIDGASTEHHHS